VHVYILCLPTAGTHAYTNTRFPRCAAKRPPSGAHCSISFELHANILHLNETTFITLDPDAPMQYLASKIVLSFNHKTFERIGLFFLPTFNALCEEKYKPLYCF
jgi:hypothetical protein